MTTCNGRYRRFTLLFLLLILTLSTLPCAAAEVPASGAAGETPAHEAADAAAAADPDGMPVIEDVTIEAQADVVRDAQKRLAKLGFYVGSIDGKYGQYSEDAVRAFQRQYGLSETGQLDEPTLSQIEHYSDMGVSNRAIQQRLIDRGYMQGSATGYYGDQTRAAMRFFQRINGLEETGSPDADTIDMLFSDDGISLPPAVSPKSPREDIVKLQERLIRFGFMAHEATGEYGPLTAAAVQALQQHLIEQGLPVEPTGDGSPLALYYFFDEDYSPYLRDVSVGMTDGEVVRVEQRLFILGYTDLAADEVFDDFTRSALCLFQQKSGLKPDGVADRETTDVLFSDEAVALPEGLSAESAAEDVARMQERLAGFGFMAEAADGEYGEATLQAVQAFQRRLIEQGLPVEATGLASSLTLYYLYNEDYSTYVKDVSVGTTGDEAARVEQRLYALGYMDAAPDDAFDAFAREALRLFQRESGLEPTGVADRETIDALFSDRATALPAGVSAESAEEDVISLQERLARFGFMTEAADGTYGESTAEAVQSFQQHLIDQGLPVEATGTASPLTVYWLYSDDYSTYLRDVTVGTTDGEAARIERRLVDLGYMDAQADDAFDDYARDALLLFQREAGLESTGVADRKTVDALFAAAVVHAENCAPHEIASGDSGAAVRDVENALMTAGYTTKLPNGKFDAALEKGLENAAAFLSKEDSASHLTKETVAAFQGGLLSDFISPDITRLQRRLYTLCYLDKGGVDGVMGENTVAALHEFQAANGLPQTDVDDQPTLSVLFSADAAAKRYPYRVEVSIDRQEVEVWRLNRENQYDHVKTFTCSTGKNNTTPRGIFLNAFPQDRWHYFRKFLCWAQYSFVIEGDILFHSVIFGQKNENTVHRSSVRNLGNPASHGCVRLSVEDAKWLFEHCEKGKVVIVIS